MRFRCNDCSKYLEMAGLRPKILVVSHLVEVINSVPTSANAEYYAKIVAEKLFYVGWSLDWSLEKVLIASHDGASPSDEIISGAEKLWLMLVENANRVVGLKICPGHLNINFGSQEARSLQNLWISRVLRQPSRFGTTYDDGGPWGRYWLF